MLHLNDHLYTKLMCILWGNKFLVSHRRLHKPKHFHGLSPLEKAHVSKDIELEVIR